MASEAAPQRADAVKVLVADPSKTARAANARALRQAGWEVIEAATAADAVRSLAQQAPALVVLDTELPDTHGAELAASLSRRQPTTLVVQIASPSALSADPEVGADSRLARPVEPGELVTTVRALLRLRAAESALREREQHLSLVFDSVVDYAIFTCNRDGLVTTWNEGARRLLGYEAAEILGRPGAVIFTPEDRARRAPEEELEGALRDGRAADERWHVRKDGSRFWGTGLMMPLRNGEVRGFVKVMRDRTNERVAEEANARLAAIVSSSPDAVMSISRDGIIQSWNRAAEELLGYTEEEAVGSRADMLLPPESRGRPNSLFERALAGEIVQIETARLHKNQTLVEVAVTAAAMRVADGRAAGVSAVMRDIRAARRAARALRESEANFRTLADQIPTLCWMADRDGWIFWYNRRWYDYTGTTPQEMEGWGWQSVHDPEILPRVLEQWRTSISIGTPFEMVFPLRGADGLFRPFLTRAAPVRDEGGEIVRWFGTNTDVTEERRAAEKLERIVAERTAELVEANERLRAEIAERGRTEEQLRQAQKMEAVGQLTGGIAHDFNNLLQIVVGNLEILQRNLPEDAARLRRAADNAMRGGQRAAALTQRLLAFSRRQPLMPRAVDLNQLLEGTSDLLRRTLGETIALQTVLAEGLWRVEVDPNQLENAILNLAINARDAMPEGGRLTIETVNTALDEAFARQASEVQPGQYVLISIRDTGLGMPPDVLERAFEPFFTTKGVGQGTGLGLSMVYGFVKQSGGHVKVSSEPGGGTTVEIFLPRLVAVPAPDSEPSRALTVPERAREETILVVEDDDDVRAYAVEILRELGYSVLETYDGAGALAILQGGIRVDLLFTDVVLPGGMNGEQLAAEAHRLVPDLKVLFTTGYARDAIVHQGRLDPGVELVTKPFSYAELAARIREVLDGAAA